MHKSERITQTTSLSSSSRQNPTRKSLYTRWQSFAGVCFFVSVAGTTFAFGIFSALLKSYLGYSQDQLDLIASIGNNGLYLSLVAGLLIERIGFKAVVRIGGVFIFIGFMYIWMAVRQYVASNMATISFFYFLSQLGVCFHITSALTVAVKLFPHTAHGGAIGLTKGYFGLSTAVLGDIAGGLFEFYPSTFLVFIAVFIPTVGYYGSSLANILPPHLLDLNYEHRKGMYTVLDPFIIHWSILFLTLALIGYSEYAYSLNFLQQVMTAIMILTVIFSILSIPQVYGDTRIPVEECIANGGSNISGISGSDGYNSINTDNDGSGGQDISSSQTSTPKHKYLFSQYLNASDSEEDEEDRRFTKKRSESFVDYSSELDSLLDRSSIASHVVDTAYYGDSLPIAESIKTWRIWALFLHYLISTGVGLMVIYNVYPIAEAVNQEPTSFFVTLISLTNGLGRVFAGWISDRSSDYFGISKLLLLAFVVFCMGLVQGSLSIGSVHFLFPGLLLVGFLFGCTVSLTAINIADIFGEKYIATNFGLVDTSPILGSYIYATLLVTLFYRTNATDSSGADTCYGAGCFRAAFIINAMSCMVACLVVVTLHVYTPR